MGFPDAMMMIPGDTALGYSILLDLNCDAATGFNQAGRGVFSPVYDEYDAISHYVAVKEDITEKKKYIEEIITAKELAEAGSRSKSDFLATMSHELRTPMNGVIGMTDILLDTVLDDEQREYVEIVSKSGNEMLEIINNILDYSSMESRELDLETNDFNLLVTLRETADLLAVRAGNAGLELISHISSEVPTLLKGDPVHLHQIIVNLVDNAIKYTHDGEIVMRTALDSESRSSAVIRFEIQDTGIGIPSSHHVTIFAPFTQVDGSFSRKFGGIGLGLATCKKLVELMGGTIGVSSEEGEGSVFWFTARFEKQFVELEQNPAALEDDHPSREAESLDTLYALNETIPQKPQILLAEDDNANREVLSFILKSLGFRVDTVENGREAVRALETADYGLVLMDCMMPEMDGFEATAWIRDPQSTVLNHDVPIVAITSNSMTGDKEKCLKAGMNGYLPKPVNTVELVKILDTWLWSG